MSKRKPLEFRKDYIQLQVKVDTWEEALSLAAQPLIASGAIDVAYINNMIDAVKKLGPYIVIAPGLALGHARPDKSVHETAIALATLQKPVLFGSKTNDPVDIVVILAACDDQAHISLLQKAVSFLTATVDECGSDGFQQLRNAKTESDKNSIVTALNRGGK